MNRKEPLIINRLKSVRFAFRGAVILVKTEPSIKVQLIIALLVTAAGFYFEISSTEWTVQILAIALVMSIEGINTAIEEIANFIHPEYHIKIGKIKDIAAGAVFIASVFAIIVGLIIYMPKLIHVL